ncbi:MAG: hypothetical protein BRD50_08650 [Bacteroidetes bacterium SW_11_45_7]|nr:MAG: hypothetical protein BRD50_08650 [Bacteroidetes bacterium SW_11_45_7]
MNITKRQVLAIFLFVALSGLPFAFQVPSSLSKVDNGDYRQLKDTLAFKKALRYKNDTTHTIISNFEQHKQLEVMEDPIVTNGKFYFQKPGKLRWEYTDPFDYLIVINDDKVMIEDKGNTSKFDMGNNKLFQQVNDLLVNLVRGEIFSNNDYSAEFFTNESTYKVKLIPNSQDMKDYMQAIHIIFGKDRLQVQQVKMMENSSDFTRIVFSEKRLNDDIPEDLFDLR